MVGPGVTVGDNCKIQNNVSLYNGVTLEDGVFCGPSCVFTNVNNPRADDRAQIRVRTDAGQARRQIGANATIVCGHTLGEYCFIAAGAVVTTNVPAYALMAGVPARRIGWVSAAGRKLGPDLVCPDTGRALQGDRRWPPRTASDDADAAKRRPSPSSTSRHSSGASARNSTRRSRGCSTTASTSWARRCSNSSASSPPSAAQSTRSAAPAAPTRC